MTATSKNYSRKKTRWIKYWNRTSVPVGFPHGKFPFITSETEACKTSSPSFSWLYLSIREDSLFLFEEIFLRRCARCLDESEYDKVKKGITGIKAILLQTCFTQWFKEKLNSRWVKMIFFGSFIVFFTRRNKKVNNQDVAYLPANLLIEWVVCWMAETNISTSSWIRCIPLPFPCKASTSKEKYKVFLSGNAILIRQQREIQR